MVIGMAEDTGNRYDKETKTNSVGEREPELDNELFNNEKSE